VVAPDFSVGLIFQPGSGKSGAAVSYILDAPGPVLATSTKTELLLATAMPREQSTGRPTLVFDPLGYCNWSGNIRWSPIRGCEQPEVAMRRADGLIDGAKLDAGVSNGGFFKAAGSILIRLALHACALEGAGG
jgi:type IV secretion system protein VirD4